MNKQYISKKELTEVTGLSLATINRHLKSGKIKSIKLGGRVLIPTLELSIKIYEQENDFEIKSEDITYLYLMKNNQNKMIKVGISKDPECRRRTLTSYEQDLSIIALFNFANKKIATKEEALLHSFFRNKRYSGEWFKLSDNDISYIKNKYRSNYMVVS